MPKTRHTPDRTEAEPSPPQNLEWWLCWARTPQAWPFSPRWAYGWAAPSPGPWSGTFGPSVLPQHPPPRGIPPTELPPRVAGPAGSRFCPLPGEPSAVETSPESVPAPTALHTWGLMRALGGPPDWGPS